MNSMVQEFRERLRAARQQLLRRVATTDAELVTLERHLGGNFNENAATELATAVLSQLEGQEKRELDEIEAARARLETGTFGVCEDCGGPIPLARLQAMATTRYCLICQMRREA